MKGRNIFKIINFIILLSLVGYILIPACLAPLGSLGEKWSGTILPRGFTFEWYARILTENRNVRALALSLSIALLVIVLSTLINVPAAYLVSKSRNRFLNEFVDILAILPLLVPPLILGLGILQVYAGPPFRLSGSATIVIIGHILLTIPYMFRCILACLETLNINILEEAASSLGANKFQIAKWVILPNILPGILSGALMAFAISMGEFEFTNIVGGFENQTFPLFLYKTFQYDARIARTATAILIYVSVLSFLGVILLARKMRGKRPSVFM